MLDLKEEQKFKNLKDMCLELRVPPPPDVFIRMQVHDKNGALVSDNKERAHSFTRNFWNMMFGMAGDSGGDGGSTFGAGYMSKKTTGGVVFGSASGYVERNDGLYASLGDSSTGIVIGTDDTAFNIDQYALGAQIVNGVSTGQMSHLASTSMGIPSYAATTWKSTLERVFNNNSGGAIVVKETGLYWDGTMWGSGSPQMIERNVLVATSTVADAAQLTVTYEISMDFSVPDA